MLLPICLSAATNELTSALQRGLFEEEANRNLEAAAEAYQAVSAQFDKDRKVAATAVFRLGEIYRKQGKTNEAVVQYERIVREFSDQETLATLSRQNLAGLNRTPASLRDLPTAAEVGNISEEVTRLAAQLKGIEQLKDDPEEQARAVLAFFPDDTLKKMLLNLPTLKEQVVILQTNSQADATTQFRALEYKIGGYRTAFGPEGFRREAHGTNIVTDAERELRKQLSWIKERVDFNVGVQKARLQVLQAAVATTPAGQGVASEQPSFATNDEEKEIRRIQAMIQNSPDLINAKDNRDMYQGWSPLHKAARHGQLAVAKFLLANGADIEAKTTSGWAPLQLAALEGHKAMVELLLQRGADINTRDSSGGTALHLAAQKGFQSVAEVLIKHKADLTARTSTDNAEKTALHFAVERGNAAIVDLLLTHGADANARDSGGNGLLHYAATFGHDAIVERLLKVGADVNALNNSKESPILPACANNRPSTVKLLLAAKANPNQKNKSDDTPLLAAVRKEGAECVQLLLEAGADPNEKDQKGYSPLHLAVGNWSEKIAEMLLNHGANANETNPGGWTPLQDAVRLQRKGTVAALLAHKADANASGSIGVTPLAWAKGRSGVAAEEIADLLRQHGGLEDVPDFSAIRVKRGNVVLPTVVFRKDTNALNQFTLFEVLRDLYFNFALMPPGGWPASRLPFPDLSRITILRPLAGNPAEQEEIAVRLLTTSNTFDCARDVWLEFGDVIDIPEREHSLAEPSVLLTSAQVDALNQCLKRTVTFVVKGQSFEIKLGGDSTTTPLSKALRLPAVQSILRSSSDLSRVKVKRTDPQTKKPREVVMDVETFWRNTHRAPAAPVLPVSKDIWLRDGDVIEVPDKP